MPARSMLPSLLAVTGVCGVIAAYLRGYYLLGETVACCYAFVAILCFLLIGRELRFDGRYAKLSSCCIVLFGVVVGTVMAFPTTVSPGLKREIQNHRTVERVSQTAQLILDADPEFSKLKLSVRHSKTVWITISGMLPSRRHLIDLRSQIAKKWDQLEEPWIEWRLHLLDSGDTVQGADRKVFSEYYSK